jgi:hypothetical protein
MRRPRPAFAGWNWGQAAALEVLGVGEQRSSYGTRSIMQSIFRPAARRETLGEQSEGGRRDGGLKMGWTKPLSRA